jgi:hypothetical protein
MQRAVLAFALGVALAGVVLAHTVLAQQPPTPGSDQSHSHGPCPGMGATSTPSTCEQCRG